MQRMSSERDETSMNRGDLDQLGRRAIDESNHELAPVSTRRRRLDASRATSPRTIPA